MAFKEDSKDSQANVTQSSQTTLEVAIFKNPQIAAARKSVSDLPRSFSPQEPPVARFDRAISIIGTSTNSEERSQAKTEFTRLMAAAEYSKPDMLSLINLTESSGAAYHYLIEHGEIAKADQLARDVGSGKIDTSNKVLQQMENWGYHDFVLNQQNAFAANEALVTMVTAQLIQQQAAMQARLTLMQLQQETDEIERKRLKSELDKHLGDAGVSTVEEKEKIAEYGIAGLKKDGELSDDGMAKIISGVLEENNSRAESMRLKLSHTPFAEVLSINHADLGAEFAGVSPEMIREFNRRFDPAIYSSPQERSQAAISLIRQLKS